MGKLKLKELEIEKNKMKFFDENFVGDSECESQLEMFMNTQKPGGASRIECPTREFNNRFEFPNSETVVFHTENSRTGKRVNIGGTFTWKYKKFPLSLGFKNTQFVLQYVVNADEIIDDKNDGIIFCYHANDPINDFMIRIRFKKIEFSNPPGFVIADANVSGLRVTSGKWYRKQIVAADALEMFLHGLWCDVKCLEQINRMKHLEEEKLIEEFKETLKPKPLCSAGKFVFLTYLTFPFNKSNETIIDFHLKQLLQGSIIYKSSLRWIRAKFPLAVKLANKMYVFQYIWGTNEESIFVYQNELKILEISFDKKYLTPTNERSFASFAKRAKFRKCEKSFNPKFCKKTKTKVSESADTDISLEEITEAFTEGFWCDVKRIENAVDALQNTEIENIAERYKFHVPMTQSIQTEENQKDEKREKEKAQERRECEKREFERVKRCQMLWTDEKWKIEKIDPKIIKIQKCYEKLQKETRGNAEKKQTQKWESGKFEFMENEFYHELD